MKEKVSVLTDELEKTKADNVKLYGKIRYVQDYSQENLVSRGPKKVNSYILENCDLICVSSFIYLYGPFPVC